VRDSLVSRLPTISKLSTRAAISTICFDCPKHSSASRLPVVWIFPVAADGSCVVSSAEILAAPGI
jgi:hypothetical protein